MKTLQWFILTMMSMFVIGMLMSRCVSTNGSDRDRDAMADTPGPRHEDWCLAHLEPHHNAALDLCFVTCRDDEVAWFGTLHIFWVPCTQSVLDLAGADR